MKLKEYIKEEISKGKRDFNIGLDNDMEVNDLSPNRIKFKIQRKDSPSN